MVTSLEIAQEQACSSPSSAFRGRIQCSKRRAAFFSLRAALRTTERTSVSPPSCECVHAKISLKRTKGSTCVQAHR